MSKLATRLVSKSILRRFLNPAALELDPGAELARVALLVQQARLTHLVGDVTLAELEALARAGEQVADEHATLLLVKLRDQAKALAPYDGGFAVTEEVLDLMAARWRAQVASRRRSA